MVKTCFRPIQADITIGLNHFLPPSRFGLYLMPQRTVLAEILGVNSSRVGLPWGQILSDSVEAHGSSGRKHAKNPEKTRSVSETSRLLSQHSVDHLGRNFMR